MERRARLRGADDTGPLGHWWTSEQPMVVREHWRNRERQRDDVSALRKLQFSGGWYLTTSPVVSANWLASGDKWVVPIGGGFGRLFRVGKLPVNMSLSAYDNVIRPDGAANWQLRFQVQFLLPSGWGTLYWR
jgi:hypothetical protein